MISLVQKNSKRFLRIQGDGVSMPLRKIRKTPSSKMEEEKVEIKVKFDLNEPSWKTSPH
jgi:hypothetical protein